ncbi:MAG: hypothetical protein ACFKPT_02010 [Gloeotrichia echinulata GP01]
MANRSDKLTHRSLRSNPPRTGAIQHVPKLPQKKAQGGNWLSSMLAIALLISSAGLFITFAWISILFIFNPHQITWLNKFLPEWAQISFGNSDSPQTLKQIQLSLSQQQQIAGETIVLDQDKDDSFLLPVFQQRPNCLSDCQYLVELRVYQRSDDLEFQSQPQKYYHLVTQLSVTGLEESFVLAPLKGNELEHQDFSISLPLNQVKRFEGETPTPGIWFDLRGQRQEGTGAIAYGNIVYYNPQRQNLQQLLSWTSPNGQLPKWQQVTGDDVKELVIDQTVGLEPRLRVYQVKATELFQNPVQLAEISLTRQDLKDSAYQDALLLARSGLWTPAFERLQYMLKQRKPVISADVQAQIDIIRRHSQLTKIQAEKNWASPGQQVLADLIDGRWEKALQVFEASPQNLQEVVTLLKADSGRLWNRTAAGLRVDPNRPQVQAWGCLMVAVQHGEQRANSWLQAQPKITAETITYIQGLLGKLNGEVTTPQVSSNQLSRIIGSVQPLTQVTSGEWIQPDQTADLTLTDNEVWYQVEVSAFNDGKRWLNFPFGNLQLPIWETLGLSFDPTIQIVIWLPNGEQQTTIATVKAVQLQHGVLRLLAAGQPIPENQPEKQNHPLQPRPLALTNSALEWVQPSPITLSQLQQQDPQKVKAILPTMWRYLQESGQIPDGAMPSLPQMQQKLGYWPVQVIDLTNNAKPEIVLTISAQAIALLKQSAPETQEPEQNSSRPRTLILSDSGKVIYTDSRQNNGQILTAIAQITEGESPALLVENAHNYSLKRWSEKNQRFE